MRGKYIGRKAEKARTPASPVEERRLTRSSRFPLRPAATIIIANNAGILKQSYNALPWNIARRAAISSGRIRGNPRATVNADVLRAVCLFCGRDTGIFVGTRRGELARCRVRVNRGSCVM